jgi:hypothetical protein
MIKISKLLLMTASMSTLVSMPVLAEGEVQSAPYYQMINTLTVSDPKLGTGIEMVFQVDSIPEGGFTGDVSRRDMEIICSTWAQNVVSFVKTRTKMDGPKFLQVMVKHGGIVGTYSRKRFDTDGKRCIARDGN